MKQMAAVDGGGESDRTSQFRSRQERLQNMLPFAEFVVQRLDARTLAHTIVYCRLNEPRCQAAGIFLGAQDTVEGLIRTLQQFIKLHELCRTTTPFCPRASAYESPFVCAPACCV